MERTQTAAALAGRRLVRLRYMPVLAALLVGLISAFAAPVAAAPSQGESAGVRTVDASQFGTANRPVKSSADDAAPFPVGDVYCTRDYKKRGCLKLLTGEVTYRGCGKKSLGGDVNIVVQNSNRKQAPRDIAVFVLRDEGNGPEFVEIFGDRDWAKRGENVVEYRGLPNGTYFITVGWADQKLAFYGNAFTVDCAGGAEPTLPPPPPQ